MRYIQYMAVNVEGVRIELTPEQIALVEARRKFLRQSKLNFLQVLRKYGFVKLPKEEGVGYIHPKLEWWAHINDTGFYPICEIAGAGIPKASSPGPWTVDEPVELAALLNKALDNPETWEVTYSKN